MFNRQLFGLPLFKHGRLREMYDLGAQLLIVASDRVACFGVVLPTAIPDKGKLMTAMSDFWFAVTADLTANHLVAKDPNNFPAACRGHGDRLAGRSLLVRKANAAPFVCVVRGYLFGSAWREYRERGQVIGIRLPKGLLEASRLTVPIFAPYMKTTSGEYGEDITFAEMAARIGKQRAQKMRDISVAIYRRARALGETRGVIIAETKLEFGCADEETILIDELLTADTSRFWLAEDYQPGCTPESCDSHYLRGYLRSVNWDRRPPVPTLPPEIVRTMQDKYQEVVKRLTASPNQCLGIGESKAVGMIPGAAISTMANPPTQVAKQIGSI